MAVRDAAPGARANRLATPAKLCDIDSMTVATLANELRQVPAPERGEVIGAALRAIYPESGPSVARLMRRIENPDIPEDVWRGIEDAEEGRLVDMETALSEPPPCRA